MNVRDAMTYSYALHTHPVWRDRADFIINAPIENSDSVNMEQLWVRRDGDNLFEICCIPFFLYGVALGDLVSIKTIKDGNSILDKVVRASTHYSFRIWFGGITLQIKEEVMEDLRNAPILVEVYSDNLIAIDADGGDDAQRLADYLADAEQAGRLTYETSRL